MSKPLDDTTEPEPRSPSPNDRPASPYYDDDSTGYQPYRPEEDDGENDDNGDNDDDRD